MDATRLRILIDAAIIAQDAMNAAEDAKEVAHKARDTARERQVKEVGNLKAVLDGAFVIYGDRVVRVGCDSTGILLVVSPLLNVPVLAPPPAPLPEGTSPSIKVAEQPKPAPLSGGKVPELAKKPMGGK